MLLLLVMEGAGMDRDLCNSDVNPFSISPFSPFSAANVLSHHRL